GRAARAKAQIKVRQPLAEVAVAVRGGDPREQVAVRRHEQLILEELNAKALSVEQEDAGLVTFSVKPTLRVRGPRLGASLNEVRTALSSAPPQAVDAWRRGR